MTIFLNRKPKNKAALVLVLLIGFRFQILHLEYADWERIGLCAEFYVTTESYKFGRWEYNLIRADALNMKLLFLWRSLRCSVMQQRTDESRLVCLQDFVNACICTALCRLGFTQLLLCWSVCLSASFPCARSFAVTGNSFCSTGEENLQTLETALVPHTTLNSVIFLDN